jgi:hypothetical protein
MNVFGSIQGEKRLLSGGFSSLEVPKEHFKTGQHSVSQPLVASNILAIL